MFLSFQDAASILLVGAGATAVMDLWLALLKRLGMPGLDMAYLGRWAGHLLRGRLRHDAIAKAAPIAGERAIGWALHYAIGVLFAALLVLVAGMEWLEAPTFLAAVTLGLATVAAPLLVMQPAMGAGIASSRTPTPVRNTLRSVANHAVFGAGLYLIAIILSSVTR